MSSHRVRTATTVAAGRRFEDAAADHLRARGYRLLARNYRFGRREIDLIADADGVVVFVEVKGRRRSDHGHPLAAITRRKRRDVEEAARAWMRENPGFSGARFDAISVEADGEDPRGWCITHVEDAWRPGLYS
jgi:putative endonuclease